MPSWTPLHLLTLENGSSYFSDSANKIDYNQKRLHLTSSHSKISVFRKYSFFTNMWRPANFNCEMKCLWVWPDSCTVLNILTLDFLKQPLRKQNRNKQVQIIYGFDRGLETRIDTTFDFRTSMSEAFLAFLSGHCQTPSSGQFRNSNTVVGWQSEFFVIHLQPAPCW